LKDINVIFVVGKFLHSLLGVATVKVVSAINLGFWRKMQKMNLFPKKWLNQKTNGTSESAPQELSNEWSCQ
jgi:hypothetical protein